MQIYVCVKHVPDSAVQVTIIDSHHIDENIPFLINPYDEHAVTEAVRIRDTLPGSEVVALCLGNKDAEKTLRSAMAMGADRSILVESGRSHDSIETALALKAAIGQDGSPGLIFTGRESIDDQGMQTMFRLGALMGFPVATNVVRLEIMADRAVADTEFSGGIINTYEMRMPCVIGAGRGLNTPRYPTFPDVMKSKKKPVQTLLWSDLNIPVLPGRMEVMELSPHLQKRKPRELTGNAGEVARQILQILKHEAKVI